MIVIVKEKESLIKQIKVVRDKADEDAKMGIVHTNNHDARYAHRDDTINAAKNLEDMVNTLSSQKLIEFQSLLDNLLAVNDIDTLRELAHSLSGKVVDNSVSDCLSLYVRDAGSNTIKRVDA